jgi:hypothetical protein
LIQTEKKARRVQRPMYYRIHFLQRFSFGFLDIIGEHRKLHQEFNELTLFVLTRGNNFDVNIINYVDSTVSKVAPSQTLSWNSENMQEKYGNDLMCFRACDPLNNAPSLMIHPFIIELM